MGYLKSVVLVLLGCCCFAAAVANNFNFSTKSAYTPKRIPDEQILLNRLLKDYDPASRPIFNAAKPVHVQFGISFTQICDMDERNQILTSNVWFELEWIDERLRWDQNEFSTVDKIRIPCNKIWLPDLVLYNSADDYTQGYAQIKAIVDHNGRVFWSPPVKLRSICKIVCYLKFGSWAYSGNQINLTNKSAEVDLSNYVKSGEWDVRAATVSNNIKYYSCCPDEPYHDVMFHFFLRRRVLYYIVSILIPCLLLSAISVMTFWLPPDSGEKVALSITVLLSFSVFMLLIAENVPTTSETVPLIGVYLTVVMVLTSLSIAFTIFILELHHSTPYSPRISPQIFNLLTMRLAPMIGLEDVVRRFEVMQENAAIRARIVSDELDTARDPQFVGGSTAPVGSGGSSSGGGGGGASSSKRLLLNEFYRSKDDERTMQKRSLAEAEEMIQICRNEWKLVAILIDRLLFRTFTVVTILSSVILLAVIPLLKNANIFKTNKVEE